MRKARVYVNGILAGIFEEGAEQTFCFAYDPSYQGPPISLTLPVRSEPYAFNQFPAFFDGLLPEGIQLEALLRKCKLDKSDYFGQLSQVGQDLVGAVTVKEIV